MAVVQCNGSTHVVFIEAMERCQVDLLDINQISLTPGLVIKKNKMKIGLHPI